MIAMTYRGPYRVRAENKPEPRIEHPNDVIVRVTRTAICGSDLHLYHGLVPDTRVGSTFGHEFTGVVEEAGPSVRHLKVGERVMVPFNISCGTCFFCTRELFGYCENTNPCSSVASGIYGYSHTTGGYDGGQAEYVRVPFADVGPMKIPDDMDDESVLFLTDILPTGYQAAEMGEIKPVEDPSWATDKDQAVRPGVPMESVPHPAAGSHWERPERQPPTVTVLKRPDLESLTPVFGTATPPRGLSGWLRRAAYRIPDHHASHWMILLFADRVDVVESGLRERPWILAAGALGLGYLLWTRRVPAK